MAKKTHIEGMAEVLEGLSELADNVEDAVADAMEAGLERTKNAAVGSIRSRSGDLARSLKAKVFRNGDNVRGTVYSDGKIAYYARFVEFGTATKGIRGKKGNTTYDKEHHRAATGDPPHPFLFPAYDATKGQIQQDIHAAVDAALEEGFHG